jgi:TniB protein
VVTVPDYVAPDLSHLHPAVRQAARLPANERVELIRADRWIGYPRAVETVARLETLLCWPDKQRMPNLLLVGPTNNGKSMIVEKFRRGHLPATEADREYIPVLCVQMPSEPSVLRFYIALLAALGPVSENRPSGAGTIRQIWKEAGYPARDGQALWRPYEQQQETVQRHTMEAAAAAIALLETGSITGRGTHAALFLSEPYQEIESINPPAEQSKGKAVDLKPLGQALEEAFQAAREDPVEAQALYNFALIGCGNAESVTRLRADFAALGIPLEHPSHINE